MSEIKLTPSRAAVLRAVARGEVHLFGTLRADRPDESRWLRESAPTRKVNREIADLRDANLVDYRRERGRLGAAWKLTDLGKQWIAEHPGD